MRQLGTFKITWSRFRSMILMRNIFLNKIQSLNLLSIPFVRKRCQRSQRPLVIRSWTRTLGHSRSLLSLKLKIFLTDLTNFLITFRIINFNINLFKLHFILMCQLCFIFIICIDWHNLISHLRLSGWKFHFL
jgi:hypothetical protein